MRQGFRGFLAGVGITLTLAVGVAYAIDPELEKSGKVISQDLIDEVNKLVNNYCDVYVGYGRINTSGRCFRNEVMTGLRDGYIYCSEISVDCFSKKNVHSTDEHLDNEY